MELKSFEDKFICVFCDERQRTESAYIINGRVGICKACFSSLSKTSPSLPYKGTRDISYIMSPFEYKGSMRETIIDFKFAGCRAYAPLLADMMREYLDSYDIWEEFNCIIPVPLHKKRFKERGYNQSELVAQHVSEYLGIPMSSYLLSRIRATKQQSTLKSLERVKNVSDAFRCEEDLSGMRILLFDDICTTGNTLQACASALKSAGAETICALTLSIHEAKNLPIIMY